MDGFCFSERRKKLTARPVVYQTPGANRRRAANLARTTGMVGVVRDIVVPGLLPCSFFLNAMANRENFEDDHVMYCDISFVSFATHYSRFGSSLSTL